VLFKITHETLIEVQKKKEGNTVPEKKSDSTQKEGAEKNLTFKSIGGLGPQLAVVREIIELPLKKPEIFTHFGLNPPRGKFFS
jgi:ATP-dependent 26S proteasome regulatory subunit